MNNYSMKQPIDILMSAIADTLEAWKLDSTEKIRIHMWPQTFGDTCCGFAGISGAAMTTAMVVVISTLTYHGNPNPYNDHKTTVRVYSAGNFAYEVTDPTELFLECMSSMKVPGQSRLLERRDDYEHGRNKKHAGEPSG